MPKIRCCFNVQRSRQKRSYVFVWNSIVASLSYEDLLQLLGLEVLIQLLARRQVLAGRIGLPTEMIFAPSTLLMTGAGRRITLVPHL